MTFVIFSSNFIGCKDIANKFFELLEHSELCLEKIGTYEPVKEIYTRERAIQQWTDTRKGYDQIAGTFIGKIKEPKLDIHVYWARGLNARPNTIVFYISKKTYQAMFGKLLSVYQKVFELVQGIYGYISHIESVKRQHVTGDLETRIPGVFLRNYFGVPYIDFFGREKLLSGTWSSVDEWPSGIIEACLSDDPADILASNEKELKAQIYLGLEYFGDIDLYQKNPRELQAKNVPKLILPDIRVDVE